MLYLKIHSYIFTAASPLTWKQPFFHLMSLNMGSDWKICFVLFWAPVYALQKCPQKQGLQNFGFCLFYYVSFLIVLHDLA